MELTKGTVEWSLEDTPPLRDQAASVLRDALLSGKFRPGERLIERSLADRTGVSRTSVREALTQLQSEGLVTREPGKGMYVSRVSETEALAIYEARAILEAAMARLFVLRATADDMEDLDEAVQKAERTNTMATARQHAKDLDHIFEVITRGAGNPVASQMASVLRTRATYLRTVTTRVASPERRAESMKLLQQIRKALRDRDPDAAEQVIRGYIERSAAFAAAVLRSLDSGDSISASKGE